MKIMQKQLIKKIDAEYSRSALILVFIALVFAIGYGYSFTLDSTLISLAIGIVGVTVCVSFYFAFVHEKKKLVRLFRDVHDGIYDEQVYTFLSYDIYTEHDGVRMRSANVSFVSDGETFTKTLYFVSVLPHPKFKENQKFKAKTFRNTVIETEEQL